MCSLRRAKTKFVKSVGAKHSKKDNRQDDASVDKEKRELIKDTFIPNKRQNLVRAHTINRASVANSNSQFIIYQRVSQ